MMANHFLWRNYSGTFWDTKEIIPDDPANGDTVKGYELR